jgi:hypothetical protein
VRKERRERREAHLLHIVKVMSFDSNDALPGSLLDLLHLQPGLFIMHEIDGYTLATKAAGPTWRVVTMRSRSERKD